MFIPYPAITALVAHPFTLSVPQKQEARLATTCFRPGARKAGNFRLWQRVEDIIQDPAVERLLIAEIQRIIKEDTVEKTGGGTWSFTLECPDWIGWTSSVPLRNLQRDIALTEFKPNRHTRAAIVADKSVPSPRTKLVTFVCNSMKPADEDWIVIIQSLYPGPDVPLGEFRNPRIIEATEAVFFSWDNPGA